MGKESTIQWTESSWNPWHGCIKVSPGCKYCYMYRDKERYGVDPTVVVRSKGNFNAPTKWAEPKVIFTCSWSDWFIEQADPWRDEAWKIIKNTPHHTYQILTKRPERILDHLPADWAMGYPNVWLGVSCENQKMADERIKILSDVNAKVRFLSIEPMLEPITLSLRDYIDWIIVGGESGNETGKYQYRPCFHDWIKSIIDQADECDIPVFVKQLGTYLAKAFGLKDRHAGDINEWPHYLRIRQFPAYRTPFIQTAI